MVYNDDRIIIKNLELTNENTHLDSLGNTKTISGFGGSANTWGSGKNVRFGIKVVTDTDSLHFFVMDSLEIHHIFPTPSVMTHAHKGYGIKFESQSDTSNYDYNLLHKSTSFHTAYLPRYSTLYPTISNETAYFESLVFCSVL